MLLWFAGFALVVTWLVFHDPAIDYRLVVAGAVVPDAVDAASGGAWVVHSLLAPAAVLAGVMLLTPGRRHARRRWLALPIGMLLHLVADGAWADTGTLWWPFAGEGLDRPLPSLNRPWLLVALLEAAGTAGLVWFVRRFRLADPAVRATFWRTGRVPRDRVV